jgi:hexulose-6-phosphate isomerase
MKKGINYWAFLPEDDGSSINPIKAMRIAKDLGYDVFELTVDTKELISQSITYNKAEKIRKEADKIGIELVTLASGLGWNMSPTDPDIKIREEAVNNYKKLLEIAFWLGVEVLLYLPGMVSANFIPDFIPQRYDLVDKWARESLNKIIESAEKYNVKIGVENVWNKYLLSPVEMRDFIDSFKTPLVGSYFDVGNVLLYGHPEHWIEILGKRIFAIHLKDFKKNVGNLDGFVDLLCGDVNYPFVMKELKKIRYHNTCIAEIIPAKLGCIERAIISMRIIEHM